jgi:hypothetical protein
MKTTLKIGAALVVSIALVSVFVFAQPPAYTTDETAPYNEQFDLEAWTGEHPPMTRPGHPQEGAIQRSRLLLGLFRGGADLVEVSGSFQGFAKNLMVLEADDGIISVIVPRVWSVDGEIMRLRGLVESGFLNEGDVLEVEALKKTVVDPEDGEFTVYVLFGYSIYDVDADTSMDAILPFNIEASG